MLPYSYKLVNYPEGVNLILAGRNFGRIDQVVVEKGYTTFKYQGKVVRQHITK